MRGWLVIAGLNGAVGVALGAYAAHGLGADAYAQSLAERASSYQLLHSLALVAVAALSPRLGRLGWVPGVFFTLGLILFCGSLMVRVFSGQPFPIPMVTPLGGVCFMLGWIGLAVVAIYRKS